MVMELMPVRLPQGLVKQMDTMVKHGLYSSKSDVIRDAIRRLILDNMAGIIPNSGDSVKEVRTIRKMLSKKNIDLEAINRL